jgi:HSP20 family protein
MSINEKISMSAQTTNVDDRIGAHSCKNFSLNRKIAKFLDVSFGGPTMNMYENLSQVVVELELTGVKLEDIKLDVAPEHSIVVSATIQKNPKFEGYKSLIDERPFEKYRRRIFLSPHAEAEKMEADFQNGLLTIVIPKHANPHPDPPNPPSPPKY